MQLYLHTVALTSKFAASEIASRILGFTTDQRRLLFGLTSSHAAAILAVIMVGYRIGIIDENVINGTIILILITCLVSSVVTESAGRKIALSVNENIKQPADQTHGIYNCVTLKSSEHGAAARPGPYL